MSTDKITYIDFTPDPLPPVFSADMARWQAQRTIELADYVWRAAMARMYPQTLPQEVPYHYSRKQTMLHAYGRHPLPVDTVGHIRKAQEAKYRRIGMVQNATIMESRYAESEAA